MVRDHTPEQAPAKDPQKADPVRPRSAASEDLIAFGTRIPERLAREVRAAAALEGESVQVWVADALREKLGKN